MMTPAQFEALATLSGLRDSRDAVRMVLIDGLTQAEAARQTGMARQNLNKAIQSMRQNLALARAACGLEEPA